MRVCIKLFSVLLIIFLIGEIAGCSTPMTYEQASNNVNLYGIPYWKSKKIEIENKIKYFSEDIESKIFFTKDIEFIVAPHLMFIVEKLNDKADHNFDEDALTEAMKASDIDELDTKMTWLRWKILSQNADGRYAFAYAYDLSQARSKSGSLMYEASLFYILGRLAVTIDGARCEDRGSYQAVLKSFDSDPRMQNVISYISNMSKDTKNSINLNIVAIEEMRGPRKPQEWLCKSGALSLARAAIDPANVKISTEIPKMPNVTVVQVDTSKLVPKFVRDEKWKILRNEIISNTLKSVVNEAK